MNSNKIVMTRRNHKVNDACSACGVDESRSTVPQQGVS